MNADKPLRLGILYPGDRASRDRADPAESRFSALFEACRRADILAEPVVYHDDFRAEVRQQLRRLHGVVVWHNPVEGGRDRSLLDELLREVAASGVFVSAHPDTILALGTKDVLLSVRDLPFGTESHRIESLAQLDAELPDRLRRGARVLKQRRGHSGIGVWRIERRDGEHGEARYLMRHAQRGGSEELVDVAGVRHRLAPYFENGGWMIDQPWQARMVEGMTRAYLVRDRVAGFGHQALIALHPAAETGEPVLPGPRLYSGADDPRFQALRLNLERSWIGLLCTRLEIGGTALPLLWDADFLLGERSADGVEHHVLCEINVSSVSPFPDSAIGPLVAATQRALQAR